MPFAIYDKQDDVPEPLRDVYEERDGKWHAKVPDVSKLNSAIEKERLRAETEEKARKDAERERDALKREKTASSKGVTDEQLEQLRKEDADKRKPIEDENARLKAENDKLKRTDKVRAEALRLGIMQDRIEDAMLLLESRTRLGDTGGIVVRDKDGKDTTETLDSFLSETFKKEKPYLYGGSGTNGTGSEGSNGGGGQGSYDPVAAGKAAAKEQKQGSAERELAFK